MNQSRIANWVSQFVDESCVPAEDLSLLESAAAARLLQRHLLAPRAFRLLSSSKRKGSLAHEDMAGLRRAYLASLQRQAQAAADVEEIRDGLKKVGVRPIFLKGIHLARRFYPHPEDRIFSDVDLYIRPEDRKAAEAYFFDAGFGPSDERPKFQANRNKLDLRHKERRDFLVDCHFSFGHGRYELRGFWERAVEKGDFLELTIEDEFNFLLYHALVQHRMEKLAWLGDMMRVREAPGFNEEIARARAAESNMASAFKLAWFWMDQLQGKSAPDARAEHWWQVAVLKSADGKPWQVARMRSLIYGGWVHFLDYAVRHKSSAAYFRITSALNSLTEGPQ